MDVSAVMGYCVIPAFGMYVTRDNELISVYI